VNDEEFRLLDQIEDRHWWFTGKRLLLRALLGKGPADGRLLDLGCGTGGILNDWSDRCVCIGVDRSRLAVQICRRRGLQRMVRGDLGALPIASGSCDWVLALDVIEHLDDDVGFLTAAASLCAPGGRMLVAVPAYQALWSRHDETFQHRRRYSASQLEAVVRRAGLLPERITYTNSLLFPVAALWRLLMSRTPLRRLAPKTDFLPVPAWLNHLLVAVYRLEARRVARVNLPFGLSAVCIATRPHAA